MKIGKTRFAEDITLIHENGYRGRLYGESSMSIWDKYGNEVLHTGHRNINTPQELEEVLDRVPYIMQILEEMKCV